MISLPPLIAGFGPLGLPELLIISVLIFIIVAPILAVAGFLYFFFKRKPDTQPKDQAESHVNQNKD